MWLLLLLLNYALAWYAARMVARCWLDAKTAGRWAVAVCWAGAAVAALGFTWCYLTLVLAIGHSFGLIIATKVRIVFEVGSALLVSLAVSSVLLLAVGIRLRVLRARYIRGAGQGLWRTYYGATLAQILKVTGNRDREQADAGDPGTMIVLFALLAATAILGVVQTYMMIRAGVVDTARQVADEYRQAVGAFEIEHLA